LSALTSANQITIDFSGASLSANEIFRGGFFTDVASASSLVGAANFVYIGTDGFAVHFDGFVTESSADFAGGPVLNGSVLQFNISGGNTVPDASSTWLLLCLVSAPHWRLDIHKNIARDRLRKYGGSRWVGQLNCNVWREGLLPS
jgi:hypothetical protein